MKAPKEEVLRRLSYIEGHMKGIRKMVEEDKYCLDILKQTHAIKGALDKLEALLVEGHLQGCVRDKVQAGHADEALAELAELFSLPRR
jgi:DNA-binding FrmR family transcriptional regulator